MKGTNPTFFREEDEYTKNSKGVIYQRLGKSGGKTYVWEIAEAIQEWYDKGVPETNTPSDCTCNKDCSCGKDCIDLTDKVTWISQFNKSERTNGVMATDGCWRKSRKLLVSAGLSKTSGYQTGMITTAKENDTHTSIAVTSSAKAGVDYIDAELEKGNPVLLGVRHSFKSKEQNYDNTTDHYVVVVGRGCENEIRFFRFYEVGTSNSANGQHDDNKLFVNEDWSVTGNSKHKPERTYTLTQVRGNKTNGNFK